VGFPVLDIDSARPTHLCLQLFRSEVLNPLNRNDRVEPFTELIQLWLHLNESCKLALEVNKFLLIFVRHSNLSASRFELTLYFLSNVSGEVLLDNIFKLR
jgi:hypothetical protein